MSEASEKKVDLACPGCGKEFSLRAEAAFSPEILTVVYHLEPGRKMAVEDFCSSLSSLAKAMKLSGKELGANVIVTLESVSIEDRKISASVQVLEIVKRKKP